MIYFIKRLLDIMIGKHNMYNENIRANYSKQMNGFYGDSKPITQIRQRGPNRERIVTLNRIFPMNKLNQLKKADRTSRS